MPSYVVLAHELIHAQRRFEGIENNWRKNQGQYFYDDIDGNVCYSHEKPEELETVGIDYYNIMPKNGREDYANLNASISYTMRYVRASKYRYSENAIRRENGLNIRVSY